MVTDVRLPKVAEGGATAVIARILVSPGETVERDQPLVEVESEKASVEIPSPVAGEVQEVLVKVGDEVAEDAPLVRVALAQGQATTAAEEAPAEAAAPPPVAPRTPEPQPTPVAAPAAKPTATEAEPSRPNGLHAPPVVQVQTSEERIVPAAPSVRRLARELGIAIEEVPGSGPGGRISRADVKAYARERLTALAQGVPVGGALAPLPLPDFAEWGPVERVPLNSVRRAMARHLAETWPRAPQVTQYDEADITELEELRRAFAPRVEARGGKLTTTAILLKVVAVVLARFPKFRASLDVERQELIVKHYTHIGVAVDTERGLVVPVIRDVDQKNILELAVELQAVAERARQGRLTPEELQGGTFSISNLGGIAGTAFSPVVNGPEVAILGVARAALQPRYVGEALKPRLILPLSLSYDHRVIDGAEGARFLHAVVETIENPFLLALEG